MGIGLIIIGDDLFAKIILERYKELEFVAYVEEGVIANVFKNLKNVQIRYRRPSSSKDNILNKLRVLTGIRFSTGDTEVLSNILEFDAVIEIGGSIFTMNSKRHTGFGYYLRRKKRNVVKNYFVIGSNFGPFYAEKQRKNIVIFLLV